MNGVYANLCSSTRILTPLNACPGFNTMAGIFLMKMVVKTLLDVKQVSDYKVSIAF